MSNKVWQYLGVFILAVIFSITCCIINEKRAKKSETRLNNLEDEKL
jgi:hypothetical protein